VRGNKSVIARLNKFGFDLHALFVTGARSGSSANTAADANGTRLAAVGAA
jgi:biopolymer transport protein ExbB